MSDCEALRARMGFEPGTNPLHVVTNDPYDLRPALTVTKNEIQKAYKNLEGGQILLVNFGEAHSVTTHIALQIMLTQWMHDNAMNPLISLEIPDNIISSGNHPAKAMNTKLLSAYSPYTHTYLNHQLWTQNIATTFVDARRQQGSFYLDKNDPITKTIYAKIESDIDVGSSAGMHIRNMVMLKRAFDAAAKGKHNVIFLSQGQDHVFGNSIENCDFKHSTQGIIDDKEAWSALSLDTPPPKALAALPHYQGLTSDNNPYHRERSVPKEAFPHIKNTIIPDGLSEAAHKNSTLSHHFDHWGEKRTLQKIFEASGETGRKLPSFFHIKQMARSGTPCFT